MLKNETSAKIIVVNLQVTSEVQMKAHLWTQLVNAFCINN